MGGSGDERVNPYLRVTQNAQAAKTERLHAAENEHERARREAEEMALAIREVVESYKAAVQEAAQVVRLEAAQAAEALRHGSLSPIEILSSRNPVQGWIMWRKWRGSCVEFNSLRVYGELVRGHIPPGPSGYPEHAYGFALSKEGVILAYEAISAGHKRTSGNGILACRDATDEELSQGCPRGAVELTRGFFGVSETLLNDHDPGTAAARWRRLLVELINQVHGSEARAGGERKIGEPDAVLNDRDPGTAAARWRGLVEKLTDQAYRNVSSAEAASKSVDLEDEIEQLKSHIIAAPNAQWVEHRHGPVSYTRPRFGKPKPVYEDLDPAISLGPLEWRNASNQSSVTFDSGLTAKGAIISMGTPLSRTLFTLQESAHVPLRRVARSLGLIR
jgi:hypothetical protein